MTLSKISPALLVAGVLALGLAGCSGPNADAKNGALIGAGAGAATGAVLSDDDLEGAVVGGAVGAAIGGLAGHMGSR